MDGLKSQSLGNQRKKFLLQTSEPVQHHLFCFCGRGGKSNDSLIRCTECGNTLNLPAGLKQIVADLFFFDQIPRHIRLLLLCGRVHHRADDKRPLSGLVVKFQGNMGGQSPRPLIRPVLPSGFAADIAV